MCDVNSAKIGTLRDGGRRLAGAFRLTFRHPCAVLSPSVLPATSASACSRRWATIVTGEALRCETSGIET